MKLSDQIRRAIDDSGLSRYRICMDLGISQSLISRFMAGEGGLSVDMLDRIGEYLGLQLQQPAKRSTRAPRQKRPKGRR